MNKISTFIIIMFFCFIVGCRESNNKRKFLTMTVPKKIGNKEFWTKDAKRGKFTIRYHYTKKNGITYITKTEVIG